MLEPIVAVFRRLAGGVSRVLGRVFSRPAASAADARGQRGRRSWAIRGTIVAALAIVVGFYGYFFYQTQVWTDFDPDFVDSYRLSERTVPAGQTLATPAPASADAPAGAVSPPRQCQSSAIVDVAADLTDRNVNRNAWISSMLLYRLGFFGVDWDHTPFFDNKASFQRGVNQALRRTTVELVDSLARVRGTSGIDTNLQDARNNLQFDEYSWYFGLTPFGPKTPTPSYYRAAIDSLKKFNIDLAACVTTFDSRADNLVQFVDRIANDLGSTTAILRERSENHNGGWFDTRADDRFWFAYGQLYGYYAVLSAAGADFSQVIRERNLGPLWTDTLGQFKAALRLQPTIISNGREDGMIMPTHLSTMGFYMLRVRSNLVEVRSVLDR